jgi:mRNA interferase HigB
VDIVDRKHFERFKREHADAARSLQNWYATVEAAEWRSFVALRQTYRSADYIEGRVVFNIKGNDYRLITTIDFAERLVILEWFGSHAEYDKGKWRGR